jgi:N-acylneuraminate cytidylyltransferase
MTSLALIPARGGSKRLPRKNVLPFAGRPMLGWSVQAARDSGAFDRVVVTTDDEEIAAVARAEKAEVMMRPAAVSDDAATLVDVVHHTVATCGYKVTRLCLLPPNCPLRNAEDVRGSAKAFAERKPPSLLSVVSYGWARPFLAQFMRDHRLTPAFDDWIKKKTQLYPEVVCPSGAIYWTTPETLAPSRSLYVEGLEGFTIPWHRGVDIDTPQDFALAACIRHAVEHGFRFED